MIDYNLIVKQFHVHEGQSIHCPMNLRLARATGRLEASIDANKETTALNGLRLRDEQKDVFADAAEYFRDAADRSAEEAEPPFARIVLPPRTGKTVVAGFIIRFAGLHALFVVPTKILVQQTADKLRMILPDIPIGMSYGDEKTLVKNGINVVTYAMLQQYERALDKLPEEITKAAVIFVDEAHHAMTKKRHKILSDSFDRLAVRIALTATPDYDAQKTLNRFYPELIHEMTLFEALEMKLLAPTRFWMAEVDQDASKVSVRSGDYDDEAMGKLMSAAPFLEAATLFRYQKSNRIKPALITCRTREQARELYRYMMAFRPKDASEPQMILGDTNKTDRERILRQYEIGYCDTLISVGVLIEGWDSPKCKLLIDLSPSISLVRATQKFCRVMTKRGTDEAHIYCIVPANLPRVPLYPIDILGYSVDAYTAGEFLDPQSIRSAQGKLETKTAKETPEIKHVKLAHRIVASFKVEKPKLKRGDIETVRRMLTLHEAFDAGQCWSYLKFLRLVFNHSQFTGTGKQLLNYLGIPKNPECYQLFLEQTLDIRLPEGSSRVTYRPTKYSLRTSDREGEYERLRALFLEPNEYKKEPLRGQDGWNALGGKLETPMTPEETAARQEEAARISGWLLKTATPIEHRIVRWRLGLDDEPERTFKEIGDVYNVSVERIRQLYEQALAKLRLQCALAKKHEVFNQIQLHKKRFIKEHRRHNKAVPAGFIIKQKLNDPLYLDPVTFRPVGFYSREYKICIFYKKT